MTQLPRTVTRRSFLRTVGIGSAVTAIPATLMGCGSDDDDPSADTSPAGGLAPFPTHLPFDGPAPDLPAESDFEYNVYLSYPSELKQAVQETPGDGSTVSMMLQTSSPPPKPVGSNQWWQALNDALGVELEIDLTPSGEYNDKLAVVMAGGDLPDVIFSDAFGFPPRFEEFVTSQCQDLSDYVAGDAIESYPNLANLPTYAWEATGRFNGGIYGIPVPRALVSNSLLLNRTLLDQVGAPVDWSRDDFEAAMQAVTTNDRWGLFLTSFWHDAVNAAGHGCPNYWRNDDGAFVSMYETDEYQAGLEFGARLWQAGVYHPDSLSMAVPDANTAFVNQSLVGLGSGLTAVASRVEQIAGSFELDFAMPYQAPGGAEPGWFTGAGAFATLLLKKADDDRTKMILRLLDYLASPFGTTEWELTKYGVEGAHFTRGDAGEPVRTEAADSENPAVGPISGGLPPFSGWRAPEQARRVHEWQQSVAPMAIQDPVRSNGLRSDTASSQGGTLNTMIQDAVIAIVTGRESMSHWDDTLARWKSDGGDAMKDEYAASYENLTA